MIEQRTPEWFAARLGKFTGSEIWKLTKSGRSKDKPFGDVAMTYIYDKVAELITNGESLKAQKFDTRATEWGREQEPIAKSFYESFTGQTVEPVSFVLFNDMFGASPDGVVDEGLLEIKCPYNPTNHIRLLLCDSAGDLQDENEAYFWQVVGELLATGAEWADFMTFDSRCTERTCFKIIRISRAEVAEEIEYLKDRIEKATEIFISIINKIS